MTIALIADWLTAFGGAEHVLTAFQECWPSAPLFTSVYNKNQVPNTRIHESTIHVSTLQKWYNLSQTYQLLLPLMPRAIEDMNLQGFDVILSSSHAVAKGIIPPPSATHICYCHTPMRYAWEMEEEYLEDFNVPNIVKPIVRNRLKRLRRWDLTTAKRVDVFIANSRTTQERIQRTYARESVVVHPPVDNRFFEPECKMKNGKCKMSYFLAVGRLVPYKRFDLLIEAANARGFPLTIVGTGREEKRLRARAGPTVEFLGRVPDDALPLLYQSARALLFPAFEDAGIVPLEAQASGTPVIAYGKGGVLDTIRDGETGICFPEQTVNSLHNALERFDRMQFDTDNIRRHARQFSTKNFQEKIKHIVFNAYSSTSVSSSISPTNSSNTSSRVTKPTVL